MAAPEPLRGPTAGHSDRPTDGLLLIGHSWTAGQVAGHLGTTMATVAEHPHLLRIDGPLCYDAAYPCMQFDEDGVRLDVAVVGMLAARRVSTDVVCDWFVRPNPRLGGAPPLIWLDVMGSMQPVLEAMPEPTGLLPGGVAPDHASHDQVAAWVRRQEDSSGRRPVAWREIRDQGPGAEVGADVRDMIDSLRRRSA